MSELEQKMMQSSRSHNKRFRGGMPSHGGYSGRNGLVFAKKITEMPDYSNEATRATEKEIIHFQYDEDDNAYGTDLITRDPYQLDNHAIYKGQWSKEGLRHGRGL